MILIECIDSNNGILFNNRRQSQDKILRDYILNYVSPKKLWMNTYSFKQFHNTGNVNFSVDDAFLDKAPIGDFCFVENTDITPYIEKIEKIILFKWNRSYPADTFFPLDLNNWTLEETEDFVGYSHDKITKEVYGK